MSDNYIHFEVTHKQLKDASTHIKNKYTIKISGSIPISMDGIYQLIEQLNIYESFTEKNIDTCNITNEILIILKGRLNGESHMAFIRECCKKFQNTILEIDTKPYIKFYTKTGKQIKLDLS
tara:strand:+ start:50 stop:412 length:363 start_codon:yes stop_codon:yes gene_type:complete